MGWSKYPIQWESGGSAPRRFAGFAAIEEAWTPIGIHRQPPARRRVAEHDAVDLLAIRQQAPVAGHDVERQAKLAPPVLPFGNDALIAHFLEHPVVEFGIV